MANRYLQQFTESAVHKLALIFCNFTTAAAGAVVAGSVKGNLVSSITRTATGKYEVLLEDKWARLLSMNFAVAQNAAGNSNVGSVEIVGNVQTAIISDTPVIVIQCLDFAGAAVDPTSGVTLMLDFAVSNSSAKIKGDA